MNPNLRFTDWPTKIVQGLSLIFRGCLAAILVVLLIAAALKVMTVFNGH